MFEIIMDPYSYPFWIIVITIIAGAVAVISKPFSSYMKFVYPNAKFEAIGNPYIKEKELDSVIETGNLDSFKEKLNSSKDYDIKGETTKDIQSSLDKNFIETIQMMKKDSSKKMHMFFDTYLEKNDFYLIKKELKNKIVNNHVKDENIEKTIFKHNKKLLSEIKDKNLDQIVNILKSYGFSNDIKKIISEEHIDFLEIDNIIDEYYIEKLKNIKVPYKCEKTKKRFIQIFIDLNNLKNVLRAKQMEYKKEEIMNLFLGEGLEIAKWKFKEMADSDSVSQAISSIEGTSYYNGLKNVIDIYNKEQSVQILENGLDSIYLKHIKNISQENYITIGPTIRFLISKEFEIRNLKVISKGISENINKDQIKELIVTEVPS